MRLLLYILSIILSFSLYTCQWSNTYPPAMIQAERYMNLHPDSALHLCRKEHEIWFLDNVPIENPNYVVKVMVTFYPKEPYDTTPIVSSRTYIPQYILEEGLVDPNGWSLRN